MTVYVIRWNFQARGRRFRRGFVVADQATARILDASKGASRATAEDLEGKVVAKHVAAAFLAQNADAPPQVTTAAGSFAGANVVESAEDVVEVSGETEAAGPFALTEAEVDANKAAMAKVLGRELDDLERMPTEDEIRSLTVANLRELLELMGSDAPKRARHADLVDLAWGVVSGELYAGERSLAQPRGPSEEDVEAAKARALEDQAKDRVHPFVGKQVEFFNEDLAETLTGEVRSVALDAAGAETTAEVACTLGDYGGDPLIATVPFASLRLASAAE